MKSTFGDKPVPGVDHQRKHEVDPVATSASASLIDLTTARLVQNLLIIVVLGLLSVEVQIDDPGMIEFGSREFCSSDIPAIHADLFEEALSYSPCRARGRRPGPGSLHRSHELGDSRADGEDW